MWSLPRWVREFQAVTIADDATATNEEIREESKFLAEAELFRTPSKKRKGGDKGDTQATQCHYHPRSSEGAPRSRILRIGSFDRAGQSSIGQGRVGANCVQARV